MDKMKNAKNQDVGVKGDIKTRCYSFSLQVIGFIETLEIKKVYFSITNQLLRSATSIGANIIEAKSASSKKDFINFYQIALKSANETKYWLCLLRDGLKIDNEKISTLLTEVKEISNIIAASILTMKKNK